MRTKRPDGQAYASNAQRAAKELAAWRQAETLQAAQVVRVALVRSLDQHANREAAQMEVTNRATGTSSPSAKWLVSTSSSNGNQTRVITGDSTGFVDELPAEDSINADVSGHKGDQPAGVNAEGRPGRPGRPERPERPERPASTDSAAEDSSWKPFPNSNAGTAKTPKSTDGTDGDDIQTLASNIWSGQSGDDFLFVEKGSNAARIRGSDGTDTVMFEGSSADYIVEARDGLFPTTLVTEISTGVTYKVQSVETISFGSASENGAFMNGTGSRDLFVNDGCGAVVIGGNGDDVYIADASSSELDPSTAASNYVDMGSGINTALVSSDASSQRITFGGGDAATTNVIFDGSSEDYEILNSAEFVTVRNINTGVTHTLDGTASISFQDTSTFAQSAADLKTSSYNGSFQQNIGSLDRILSEANPNEPDDPPLQANEPDNALPVDQEALTEEFEHLQFLFENARQRSGIAQQSYFDIISRLVTTRETLDSGALSSYRRAIYRAREAELFSQLFAAAQEVVTTNRAVILRGGQLSQFADANGFEFPRDEFGLSTAPDATVTVAQNNIELARQTVEALAPRAYSLLSLSIEFNNARNSVRAARQRLGEILSQPRPVDVGPNQVVYDQQLARAMSDFESARSILDDARGQLRDIPRSEIYQSLDHLFLTDQVFGAPPPAPVELPNIQDGTNIGLAFVDMNGNGQFYAP